MLFDGQNVFFSLKTKEKWTMKTKLTLVTVVAVAVPAPPAFNGKVKTASKGEDLTYNANESIF